MNPIREAAKRLRGAWYQGDMENEDGTACCGLGWVARVERSMGLDIMDKIETGDLMDTVAFEQYPDRAIDDNGDLRYFAAFNDHPDTTEDEVIAVMEKAAVRWDERV